MIAAYVGLIFAAGVCLFALAIAHKAQKGVQASSYQSMSQYGSATQLLQDKHDLQRFGLAQLLHRRLGGVSAMGWSLNTMGLIGGAALLYGPAIATGGPTVIGYGWPLLALFSLCVSASLAELASGVPTAGSAAHAAHLLSGRKWGSRAAWFHLTGHMASLAIWIGGCAYLVNYLLSVRFGFNASPMSFWCLAAAVAVTQAAVNHWGASMFKLISSLGAWLQLSLAAAIVGGLAWLFWPGQYSPVLLFQFKDAALSGEIQPAAFLLGLLLLLKLFTGSDGAAQAAEETIEPRISVPWAIYLSTAYTYIVGLALLLFVSLTLTATSANVEAGALYPLGRAGMNSFVDSVLAGWGGSFIALFIVAALWSSGLQTMAAASRAMFSMARDGAIPFSGRLSAVAMRYQLPVRAIWTCASAAPALLAASAVWGRGEALMPLLSIAIVCLHISYAVPIGLKLQFMRSQKRTRIGKTAFHSPSVRLWSDAPWQLGSWSMAVNAIAFVWLLASALLTAGYVHTYGAIGAALLTVIVTIMDIRHKGRRQSYTQ